MGEVTAMRLLLGAVPMVAILIAGGAGSSQGA
jgi:hypothetical protein